MPITLILSKAFVHTRLEFKHYSNKNLSCLKTLQPRIFRDRKIKNWKPLYFVYFFETQEKCIK